MKILKCLTAFLLSMTPVAAHAVTHGSTHTKTCPNGTIVRSNQKCPATVVPSFSISDITILESAGTATLTVTKTGNNNVNSVITYATSDVTTTAGSDYTATSGTLTFLPGDTTKTISIPITDDASIEPVEYFQVTISSSSNATITRATANVAISDNDSAPASLPVASPNGTTGEFNVADNFDINTTLSNTVETVPASLDPVGAFRFTCAPGHLSHNDPIVYPNQPGLSHLHQFFGNMLTDATSTYNSLRTTGGSTCTHNTNSTDPSGQRTAYWTPAMLDGIGNAVKPDYVLTYYKRLPTTHAACGAPDSTHVGYCIPIANGIRWIMGYNMATGLGGPTSTDTSPQSDTWSMGFECVAPDGTGTSYSGPQHSMADVVTTHTCHIGDWLRSYASFPSCWNGTQLDVVGHRSHIVYPDGPGITSAGGQRACPADHPYVFPMIAESAFYKIDQNFLNGTWHLSSDEMIPGFVTGLSSSVKAGTSLHWDYWEAWSPTVKNMWDHLGCLDLHLSCNVGELGNGKTLAGMTQNFPPPVQPKVPLSSITN
jgi:hypothetical protein